MSYPGVSVLMHDSKRPLHVFMSLDSIIKQTRSIELVIFWFLLEVSKLFPHPSSFILATTTLPYCSQNRKDERRIQCLPALRLFASTQNSYGKHACQAPVAKSCFII
jgi:hypothetical protein